jgi:alpha-tubulin suppressor-like RCC1 family protein
MALDESGNLWVWGNNASGQLGMNAIDPGATQQVTAQTQPQQLPRSAFTTAANPSGQSVVAIWACGVGQYGFSYAVTQDGNLWAWGYNASGQLGTGNTTTQYAPILISAVTGTAGTYFGSGAIGSITKIQVLDDNAGTTYACAAILTSTNQIYVTGNNASGWAGIGTASFNYWTNIAGGPGTAGNSAARDFWLYGTGGRYASLMQRDKNTGFCWTAGYNAYGQLGYSGTGTTSSSTFTVSKMNVSGSLYNLTNVKQLAFSSNGTYCSATVVLDNGMGFSIGNNYFGQTSIGYSSNAVQLGNNYSGGQGTATTTPALAGAFANEPNGIELVYSFVWQPMRTPPGMQGNLADCMGYNYDTSSFWLMWVNNDGRVMLSGSFGVSAQYFNPWGQIHVAGGNINSGTGVNTETMSIPITD